MPNKKMVLIEEPTFTVHIDKHSRYKIYVLDEGQFVRNVSRPAEHRYGYYYGPGLIVTHEHPNGIRCDEHYLNDTNAKVAIWNWIEETLNNGIKYVQEKGLT